MRYFLNKKNIYFAKVKQNAIIPSKKREDAGYDIYACFEEDYIEIPSMETKLIPTGIAWASSPKYYMQIEERSSTGSKGIKRSAGIIDSGYRGEIKIATYNANKLPLIISNIDENVFKEKYNVKKEVLFYNTSKAIAQGIIHKVEKTRVKELNYSQLKEIPSTRKDQGFGSTNKG